MCCKGKVSDNITVQRKFNGVKFQKVMNGLLTQKKIRQRLILNDICAQTKVILNVVMLLPNNIK